MSAHTPGPWRAKGKYAYDTVEDCKGLFTIIADGFGVVGAFEKKEDRDLAAAAPELLEALKDFCIACGELLNNIARHPALNERYYAALKIIAKAEGK